MTNESQNQNVQKKFDLVERTSNFGVQAILFSKGLKENIINKPLISQFVRSSTSIGANYMEADCAESKKDFRHKIGLCKKEAKETAYWLHMISANNPDKTDDCRKLWKESHELTLIFSSIIKR